MKWKKKTVRFAVISGLLTITLISIAVNFIPEQLPPPETTEVAEPEEEIEARYLYGIDLNRYDMERFEVERNQTFGKILDGLGIPYPIMLQLANLSDTILDVRYIQQGRNYTVFHRPDSARTPEYLVYEKSMTDYVVYHLQDSLYVKPGQREVTIRRREVAGEIRGSLYLSMQEQNISPVLAVRLSEIYAWTIDFFRIQEGDTYRVIFEEQYIDDSVFVGTGKIVAAVLNHMGEDEYAFSFRDTALGILEYYDETGESLRKAFLRAPLQFARITSRYSGRRFHPVQKRWKAHRGTDYAAPTGTPIMTTADGIVERVSYTSGNGNYVKVRHNATYSTQYLHMSRFAKGIRPGVRVKQGDVIGYVGSTGLATGPHVCYRFWKNGVQVDPLRQKLPDADPIKEELRPEFEKVMIPLKIELDLLELPGPPTEEEYIVQEEGSGQTQG